VCEIDAVSLERKPLAIGHANHCDIESTGKQIPRAARAVVAVAFHRYFRRRSRQARGVFDFKERLMDDIQRTRLLRHVDDARDVAL